MLTRQATAVAIDQPGEAPTATASGSQGAGQGTEATAQMDAIATAVHGNTQAGETAMAAAASRGPSGAEVAGAATTEAPAAVMGQEGVAGVAYT